jgi:hypothetical protein
MDGWDESVAIYQMRILSGICFYLEMTFPGKMLVAKLGHAYSRRNRLDGENGDSSRDDVHDDEKGEKWDSR